jgi:hypothetical protein
MSGRSSVVKPHGCNRCYVLRVWHKGWHRFQPKPADNAGHQQSLADQRDDNEPEGNEQNEIAVGKRRAGYGGQWNSEGRRERDNTAHADESKKKDPLPVWNRIPTCQRWAQPARQEIVQREPPLWLPVRPITGGASRQGAGRSFVRCDGVAAASRAVLGQQTWRLTAPLHR